MSKKNTPAREDVPSLCIQVLAPKDMRGKAFPALESLSELRKLDSNLRVDYSEEPDRGHIKVAVLPPTADEVCYDQFWLKADDTSETIQSKVRALAERNYREMMGNLAMDEFISEEERERKTAASQQWYANTLHGGQMPAITDDPPPHPDAR